MASLQRPFIVLKSKVSPVKTSEAPALAQETAIQPTAVELLDGSTPTSFNSFSTYLNKTQEEDASLQI